MAKQTINIGTAPNDDTGTPARDAFDICNDNFTELYDGKLSLDGSTEMTGDLVFAEAVDHSSTPAAGKGYLWVKNTAPSTLIFTDDAGTDFNLIKPAECFVIAVSDETTALTTGTGKVTFRMPYAFTLSAVRASVTTAPVGSTLTVDINEGGVSILSTVISIDASEKTSTTAATAPVISDSALADDAEITIDIDQVGSGTAGAGLKVYLIGTRA